MAARTRPLRPLLGLAVCGACVALPALGAAQPPPHAGAGRDQFPDADALVLSHLQEWTLGDDGSVRLAEHKWVKLLSPRAIRAVADPRIDFREGLERVTVLAARTHAPDGQVLEVPDYSRNVVAPGGAAGFPAFADLRQLVVSFSAVQPEAVFELRTERLSKPGAAGWLWADLRLQDDYPTLERQVVVRVPAGTPLGYRLDNMGEPGGFSKSEAEDGAAYRWSFNVLNNCDDETRSARWQQRCGRLRFTTCDGPQVWLKTLLADVERACEPADGVDAFVKQAIGEELDEAAKVRKVCDKLKAAVHFVGSTSAWSGRHCRPAAEVLGCGYASAPEAAALCLAAVRAAGLEAEPAVSVYGPTFADDLAVDSDAEAFLVLVHAPDGLLRVHPKEGILDASSPPPDWAGQVPLTLDAEGGLRRLTWGEETEGAGHRLSLRGNLRIAADGRVSGRLHFHLDGGFVDLESLRGNSQKVRLESMARRLLAGLSLTDVSVSELSADRLRAEAEVELKDALEQVGELRSLALSRDLPFLAAVDLPLDRPDRRTPVRLPWPLAELVELNLEFPEGWRAVVVPATVPGHPFGDGRIGLIEQTVQAAADRVQIRRRARFDVAEIPPEEFGLVRDALNQLRGEACRRFVFQPKTDQASQPVAEPARKNGN